MSEKSTIEWTDATWNPVRGCTKVSPGCKNCYAQTLAERFRGVPGHPFEQGFDLRLVPEKLNLPLSWKRPRRIFVNSMSDLFHPRVPAAFIAQVFDAVSAWRSYAAAEDVPSAVADDFWKAISCEPCFAELAISAQA